MADNLIKERTSTYGKFLTGSLLKHILAMLSSSALSILALSVVQLVDVLFLSKLHDIHITASIGYTGTLLFFLFPVAAGLSTAAATISGHLIGLNRPNKFRLYATNMIILSVILLAVVLIVGFSIQSFFYKMLGANGITYDYAMSYGSIMLVFVIFANLIMILNGIRSATGDAKGVLFINITMSAINAILDPIFIFYLHQGVDGAAWASLISALITLVITFSQVHLKLKIIVKTSRKWFFMDVKRSLKYFFSTAFTMVSPTITSMVGTHIASKHGTEVMSSMAIINRVIPLIFGSLAFGIGGAISPIISQNYGAKNYSRLVGTTKWAIVITIIYVLIIWAGLLLGGTNLLIRIFSLEHNELTKHMFNQYFNYLTPLWIVLTISFCLNGIFIASGHPLLATFFNFFRMVIYTAPMSYVFDIYLSKFYSFAGVMSPLYAHVSGGLVNVLVATPVFIYILHKKIKPKMIKNQENK